MLDRLTHPKMYAARTTPAARFDDKNKPSHTAPGMNHQAPAPGGRDAR